jgi:hypothetical protein
VQYFQQGGTAGALTSFNGDIMTFAFYDKGLDATQVKNNYDAYLPANNVPVGPASSSAGTVFGLEDQAAEVIPAGANYIYDFDVNGVGAGWTSSTNSKNGQTLTKFVSGFTPLNDKTGSLLAGSKTLSTFGPADSNYTALTFSSTSKDKYGSSFATIKIKAVDSLGDVSADPATLQVDVAPTNDAPAGGLGASFLINQRVLKPLNLTVSDVDCSSNEDAAGTSCDLYGPSTVGMKLSSTQQFGKIYVRPNATAPCAGALAAYTLLTGTTANFTVSLTSSLGSAPSFVLPLCIEGCAPSACPNSTTAVPDG